MSSLDLSHPIWERLWKLHKQQVGSELLPDFNRQLELAEKRMERLQELRSQEHEKETPRQRGSRNLDKRIEELQKEITDLQTEQQRWANYTLDVAEEEFAKTNKESFLGIASFLPNSIGSFAPIKCRRTTYLLGHILAHHSSRATSQV